MNYISLFASIAHAFCFFCVLLTDLSDMPFNKYFKPFLLCILFVGALYYLIRHFDNSNKTPLV